MGYTTAGMVREALAKIGTENISDEFINQAIDSATSDCDLFSGKDNWQNTDTYFQTIVGCTIQLATAYSLSILNDKDVTEMNQYKIAIEKLNKINEKLINLGVITNAATTGIAGIDYVPKATYPANPVGEVIYAVKRSGIIVTEQNTNSSSLSISESGNTDID